MNNTCSRSKDYSVKIEHLVPLLSDIISFCLSYHFSSFFLLPLFYCFTDILKFKKSLVLLYFFHLQTLTSPKAPLPMIARGEKSFVDIF